MRRSILAVVAASVAVVVPFVLAGGENCSPKNDPTSGATLVSTGGGCCSEKASTVSTGGSCSAEKTATVSTGSACSAEKTATVSTGSACSAEKTATVSTGGDACATEKTAAKSSCCSSNGKETANATLVSTEPGEASAAKTMQSLKSLVGRWEMAKAMNGETTPATIEFKLSAGGSVVVETMFPGTDHEMINTYVADGDSVLVTHYCAIGNQPRMKLVSNEGGTMKFAFQDATNLKSADEMYMGELELTIVSPDQIKQKWGNFNKGKLEKHAEFELKRAK